MFFCPWIGFVNTDHVSKGRGENQGCLMLQSVFHNTKKTPPGPGAAGPRLSKIKKYIEVHQECQLWVFQAKRSTVNPSGQVHVCQVSAYLHDKYRRYLDTCLRGQVSKAVWAQFLSRQTGTVLHKLATEGWRPGMVNLINVPFEEWQLN